jgi:hypothetical protein
MSLQTIIDRAQTIEIDRRRIVGQTISRSQRIKTSERATAQPWKFTVTPPAYLKWADSRGVIEVIDGGDRVDEYEISLSNTAGTNYITRYQGSLNTSQIATLNVASVGTSTVVLDELPSVGAFISTTTITVSAASFQFTINPTYNRAFESGRTDFLISTSEYDGNAGNIAVGDPIVVTTYVTGGQTISTVTRNYITISGISYTRIVMSAGANASSPAASANGSNNISTTINHQNLIGSSSVVFARGDFIQPENSRYPYTVTADVLRGSGTTVTVPLHRALITSEGITLTGNGILVGNSCTWQVVISGLPSYQLTPMQLVQYTGNFELIERIV